MTVSFAKAPSAARRAIPFFDGSAQAAALATEIQAAVARVVRAQRFILGEEVAAFEAEIARYLGVRHAIGVSSCTDALTIALLARGIGPGDEVITTPYTFFATTGAILRVGAIPIFADIEPLSFNLDPSCVQRAISAKTRAILPVHLFGQSANMQELAKIARAHSLALIEDAAQALGATENGVRVGTVGDSACFSFFPTKNLGAFGDGGLFTTNDDSLATAARSLRNHGFSPKHHSRRLGGNFRLDALQAAILRVKLPHLERWNALRRGHAEAYRRALAELEPQLTLPRENEGRTHVYNQYVLRSAERDALRSHLFERGIATEIYYPIPIHLQDVCAQLGHHVGDFPIAEACARECLALPIFPELEAWMICGLTEAIHDFFKP